MPRDECRERRSAGHGLAAASLAVAFAAGCASPGPPKPPSLRLPGPIKNLAAERVGDTVTLRFTMPLRTTDDLPVRDLTLTPVFCRAEEAGTCVAMAPGAPLTVVGAHGAANLVHLEDHLPVALASGAMRPAQYRVELMNSRGRTAGFSAPVWVAGGAGPAAVSGLNVQATRLGNMISWQPAAAGDAGRVIVRRTHVAKPGPAGAGDKGSGPSVVLLRADDTTAAGDWSRMLDTGAVEGETYTYTAYREREQSFGDRHVAERSVDSATIPFTLRDVFAPPLPTGLSVAGFATEATKTQPAGYAVDLIWEPVDDPGLAGYNVYRQAMDEAGALIGQRNKLTATPVALPAFHDTSATPQKRYRWSVTAVDRKGNESQAVSADFGPGTS